MYDVSLITKHTCAYTWKVSEDDLMSHLNKILIYLLLRNKICESKGIEKVQLTLTLLYITKPHKNYLQNTQHVVLRNRPTLSIGTERLACLNNPRGVQLGTLA